jgi:hypothetical protein
VTKAVAVPKVRFGAGEVEPLQLNTRLKGTVSRDEHFNQYGTFSLCADCFQGLSKAFHCTWDSLQKLSSEFPDWSVFSRAS